MPTLNYDTLVDALLPRLLAAGTAVLRYRAQRVVEERKQDGTPVSAADREAETILVDGLERLMPDIPIVAEEAVSEGHVPNIIDRAFLVDALDGTREYLDGGDDFTVNVALVENGTPIFGLLLAPAHGRLFATLGHNQAATVRLTRGQMANADVPSLTPISTAEPDRSALRALTSRSHLSPKTIELLNRLPVAQSRQISSSLKFGLIAAGEADLYPRMGPTSAWDTAAGHAILRAAGGTVLTLDGRPLRYLTTPGQFLNPPFIACGRATIYAPQL